MSAGGVFQLIANKGKSDGLLLATNLLNQRLKQVACNRKAAGLADATPTLADIEKTHVLFVNAHFKPFAAIGFEYNKVKPQSGSQQYGGSVTFSIPQFGDFFGDMVLRADLPSATALVGTFTTSSGSGNEVDMAGLDAVSATTPAHRVKYCDFPANRLCKKVKFDVNGNPLDEYNDIASAMLEKFTVAPGKRAGYNRLTGQENPITATGGIQLTDATSAGTDAGSREQRQILNGLQTPKILHNAVTVWHKLRFWFNDDCRLAVPSVSIPYGQRFITIDLATQGEMLEEVSNIYTEALTATGPVYVEATSAAVTATKALISAAPSASAANTTLGNSGNLTLELYVNNIFVNPEVHDIFIKRIGFSLIRVYRYHSGAANPEAAGEMLMSSLKWPIEYMFVGIRVNDHATAALRATRWHMFGAMTAASVKGGGIISAGTTGGETHAVVTDSPSGIEYSTCAPIVDKLTVKAHGITLYDNFENAFYNAYIPFNYGGAAIQTPDQDCGVMMVNFALYPGSAYQPSGHLNVSRAREFYLSWPATTAAGDEADGTASTLHAVAKALNFLLITDGSAVLRYST